MSQFRKIVENILAEMSYPTNFDLHYFSTIPTFKDRITYCKDRLQLLGNGSSRVVFKVDDQKVLKIAKNKKGIQQNEKEEDYGRNQYDIFAKIYESDPNHLWIEMELARKATNQDFLDHFDCHITRMPDILSFIYNQYGKGKYKFNEQETIDTENFFKSHIYNQSNIELYNLYKYMIDYQPDKITIGDWTMKSNWGVVKRNGKEYLVIIDDGLDENIFNNYYHHN